jgi:hypothetical protein
MPERHYFHNRRSLTCGKRKPQNNCLKGRIFNFALMGQATVGMTALARGFANHLKGEIFITASHRLADRTLPRTPQLNSK